MVIKEEHIEEEHNDGPPPGWQKEQPTIKQERAENGNDDDGPPPGWQQPIPSPTLAPPPPPEMAQMVCGSCRRLLSYSKGSKCVQCSCCLTGNYVLEAHQVGQVKCGVCAVLLMYPYGASSVRCSSCRSITDVGVLNKRPPLSVQQGNSLSAQLRQATAPPNPVCWT